jgi:hypothetical protein
VWLDPKVLVAALRKRTHGGVSTDVFDPIDRTLESMYRAIRRGEEPLLTNAAWALQALLEDHPAAIADALSEMLDGEKLTEDARAIVDALIDEASELA